MCVPFRAERSVLIGARQTEDHWEPPDQESSAAFQRGDVQLLAVVFERNAILRWGEKTAVGKGSASRISM